MSLLVLTLFATPALRAAAALAGAAGTACIVLAGVRRPRVPRHERARALELERPVLTRDMRRPTGARRRSRAAAVWSGDARPRDNTGSRHELAGRRDLNVAECGVFLDALEELTRSAWLEIGGGASDAESEGVEVLTAAARALDAAIAARDAAVTAWLVRDAVASALDTACSRLPEGSGRRNHPPPPCRDETLRLRAARTVAERAALAHLTRPWLSRTHHHTLTAAFAPVAPQNAR